MKRGVLGLCLGLVLWLAGVSGAMAETQVGTEINTVHSSTADVYAWTPEAASDEAGIRIVGYDEAGNVGYEYNENLGKEIRRDLWGTLI